MAALALGPAPDTLVLGYVLDDPWTCHLTLKLNGVATAWEAAPVLEFAAGITWTSTLSEAGSKATWARTVGDIATLNAALTPAQAGVRLSVVGVTQWVGRVTRRA